MPQGARKIAGGRRLNSVKKTDSIKHLKNAIDKLFYRNRASNFSDLVTQVKIDRLGDSPVVIDDLDVFYFREAKLFYVETSYTFEQTTNSEISAQPKANRFQRRLLTQFENAKILSKQEKNVNWVCFTAKSELWKLEPVTFYQTNTGFICFGEFKIAASEQIKFDEMLDHSNLRRNSAENSDASEASEENAPDLVSKPVINDSDSVDQNQIEIIVSQTGCSTEEASNALKNNNGDLVDAIMSLHVST